MSLFPPMHEVVPAGSLGTAEVLHGRPSQLEVLRSSLKGMHTDDKIHTRLIVGGKLIMTDAAFEHRTNYEVVRESRGNVLIAGLGIGMILTRILPKDGVQSVTVIEKFSDVIGLIGPHFASPKLTVIKADIFEWTAPKSAKFDVIYFDIWPDLCTDNLEQMTLLHRRFRKHLAPAGWIGSWCREYLRDARRRSR